MPRIYNDSPIEITCTMSFVPAERLYSAPGDTPKRRKQERADDRLTRIIEDFHRKVYFAETGILLPSREDEEKAEAEEQRKVEILEQISALLKELGA